MARLKRSSTVLETAKRRLAGIKSIRPNADFGEILTVAAYEVLITQVDNMLNSYNQAVASLDDLQNALNSIEKTLNELSVRMLSATGARYGMDSSEYEQAGGTRKSERKKSKKKGTGS